VLYPAGRCTEPEAEVAYPGRLLNRRATITARATRAGVRLTGTKLGDGKADVEGLGVEEGEAVVGALAEAAFSLVLGCGPPEEEDPATA